MQVARRRGFGGLGIDRLGGEDPGIWAARAKTNADLTAWYDGIRGTIKVDRDEIIDPLVQIIGDAAILTFQYVSYSGDAAAYWNCTEVYQRSGDDWRIVHSHWSFTQPELAAT